MKRLEIRNYRPIYRRWNARLICKQQERDKQQTTQELKAKFPLKNVQSLRQLSSKNNNSSSEGFSTLERTFVPLRTPVLFIFFTSTTTAAANASQHTGEHSFLLLFCSPVLFLSSFFPPSPSHSSVAFTQFIRPIVLIVARQIWLGN